VARDAAAAIGDGDIADIAQARRAFDEVAVSSNGLAPVKDAMATDSGGATDFATALLAAADVFAAHAESVHRVRHRILDIVDQTERRIQAAERDAAGSEPETPEPEPPGVVEPELDDEAPASAGPVRHEGDVETLLAEAREQVLDAVSEAQAGIEAQTNPYLATITQVLGHPHPGSTPATAAESSASASRTPSAVGTAGPTAVSADVASGAMAPPMMPVATAAGTGGRAAAAATPRRRSGADLPAAVEKLLPPTVSTEEQDDPALAIPGTRLGSAVGAAIDAETAPAFVVGDRVDGDLVLARTLLTGLLTAARARTGQSTAALGAAVSVMRGRGGVNVIVTTNEGRGWLPAGVYLPRGVASPWQFDRVLGGVMAAWEGLADPARVLVEFGRRWSERSGSTVTALVSSGPIEGPVRATLGEARMQENLGLRGGPNAAGGLDLSSPGPDMVDRLSVAEPGSAVGQADSQPYEWCLGVASEVDAGVAQAVGTGLERIVREVGDARALRARIVNALRSGQDVPDQWWQDLWGADVLIEAAMMFRRADVGDVDVGDVRVDPATGSVLRDLVFERRCTELVVLLAHDPSPQLSRDIEYARSHVTGHPSFPREPHGAARVAIPVVGKARESG
jgi:hypothetical protein